MRYAMTVELPPGTVTRRPNETPTQHHDRIEALIDERLAPFSRHATVAPYRDYITGTVDQYAPAGSTLRATLDQQPLTWDNIAAAYNRLYVDRMEVDSDGRPYTLSVDNPNGEWDSWVIGGRFHARFPLNRRAASSVVIATECTAEQPFACPRGGASPGPHHSGRADAVPTSWIDWQLMRDEAGARAAVAHMGLSDAISGKNVQSWEAIIAAYPDWTSRREAFWKQLGGPATIHAMYKLGLTDAGKISDALAPRAEYLNHARRAAAAGWAWLSLDGTWHTRTARDDIPYLDYVNERVDNPAAAIELVNLEIEP